MQTAATPDYSPDPTLTPLQHRVINMLAGGQTISATAAALNLHRNTIGSWRRSVPAFARELEHAAREQSLYWHEQAAILAPKAIEVICTILHSEDASPSIRLRAALAIVKMAADPYPKPMKPFPAAAAEQEASRGELMTLRMLEKMNQDITEKIVNMPDPRDLARSCTVQPIRRPVEPGRNSLCPCGSNVKYKRCCGDPSKPAPQRPPAAARPSPDAAPSTQTSPHADRA